MSQFLLWLYLFFLKKYNINVYFLFISVSKLFMFGLFRFFLAFNVVAFHVLSIPSIGPFAVHSFFILSGFLMTTIMHKTYGYSLGGFKKYAINRFLRLYPVYWALLAVTVMMVWVVGEDFFKAFHKSIHFPKDIVEVLANLTMLYPEFSPIIFSTRLAPATWALTIEIFYYVLIGLGLSKNRTVTLVWFGLSVVFLIYNILNGKLSIGYGNFLSASLPFSIGALLYWYQDRIFELLKKFNSIYLVVCLAYFGNIIFIAASGFLIPEQHWKFNFICGFFNLILSSLVIVILLNIQKQLVPIGLDKFLGDLSYPVYVFHWAGAGLASWLLFKDVVKGHSIEGFFVFLLGSMITIIISVVINKSVNQRIESMRSKIKVQLNRKSRL